MNGQFHTFYRAGPTNHNELCKSTIRFDQLSRSVLQNCQGKNPYKPYTFITFHFYMQPVEMAKSEREISLGPSEQGSFRTFLAGEQMDLSELCFFGVLRGYTQSRWLRKAYAKPTPCCRVAYARDVLSYVPTRTAYAAKCKNLAASSKLAQLETPIARYKAEQKAKSGSSCLRIVFLKHESKSFRWGESAESTPYSITGHHHNATGTWPGHHHNVTGTPSQRQKRVTGTPSQHDRDTITTSGHHHNATGAPSQPDRDTITTPGHHGTPSQPDRGPHHNMIGTPSQHRDTITTQPGHHHNMTGTPSRHRDTITTRQGHHHNLTGTPSQHLDTTGHHHNLTGDPITTWSAHHHNIGTPSQRNRTPSQHDRDTITTSGHHHNATGAPSQPDRDTITTPSKRDRGTITT